MKHFATLGLVWVLSACGSSGEGLPPAAQRGDVPLADLGFADVSTAPDVLEPVDVTKRDATAMGNDGPPVGNDVAIREYPPGPYGIEIGDALADLRLQGFVHPTGTGLATTQPFVNTSLGALRGEGRGHALVFIAEFL
jgi:hypothetical protein